MSGEGLEEVCGWGVRKSQELFERVDLEGKKKEIGEKMVKEIREGVGLVIKVGVD